jgi:tetratricopeptide (TPR) repeat protein
MTPAFEIELNPVYLREVIGQHGDVEAAIREAIPWVITRIVVARSFTELAGAFAELDDQVGPLRAFVSCELLGKASSRPDVRRWLCDYLDGLQLGEGARYQLAGAWSRLGVEARRSGELDQAADLARRGLESVADLPPRAVTANLYYNLGIAFETNGDVAGAIEAFGDAADIEENIGRNDEAAQAREHIRMLRNKT